MAPLGGWGPSSYFRVFGRALLPRDSLAGRGYLIEGYDEISDYLVLCGCGDGKESGDRSQREFCQKNEEFLGRGRVAFGL